MLKLGFSRACSWSRRVAGASALPRAAVVTVSAGSSDSAAFNWSAVAVAISTAVVAGAASASTPVNCDNDGKSEHIEGLRGEESLPVYRLSEVAAHKTNKSRVWVTYGDGDIILYVQCDLICELTYLFTFRSIRYH
jgi:hypothetical protein